MSDYLTDEALSSLEVDIVSNLRGGGSMTLMKAVSALVAQAKLAPDPNALPLSTAMREARRRTEAGDETWIVMDYDGSSSIVYFGNPFIGEIAHGWWFDTPIPNPRIERLRWGSFTQLNELMVERAVCRLVTPTQGRALLRGDTPSAPSGAGRGQE